MVAEPPHTVFESGGLTHRFAAMMADGVGFEPTVSLHPRRFSRPLP